MKRRPSFKTLLVLIFVLVACGQSVPLPSPIVRVSLDNRKRGEALPPGELKECTKQVSLEELGARQRFKINYRFIESEDAKKFLALEVNPDGKTEGAASVMASASVGEEEFVKDQNRKVSKVEMVITWKAKKGCSTINLVKPHTLLAGEGECTLINRSPKLLTPVK